MAKIPAKFQDVFWEVEPDELDTEKYPEYIMERILEYGTLEGLKWLRNILGDERIKQYITSRTGRRRLSTITLNFWQIILNVKPEKCMTIFSMKNRSPYWKY